MKKVKIYTDGACKKNQTSMGIGSLGVVLIYGDLEKEHSEAYRTTTNNRMELMAVIRGVSLLNESCNVTMYSDSKYVTDAFNQNWIANWKKNGWRNSKKKPVANQDLWFILLELIEKHKMNYVWVKGHNNDKYNERCDELANEAITRGDFLIDEKYEENRT